MRALIVAAALAVVAGCSSDRPPAAGSSTSSASSGGFAAPSRPGDACSAATKLVYVVSDAYDLLSFTPNTGTFARIGHIDCLQGTPNSMALDRYGTAWVNYSSGDLFKVSTADARCERTEFAPNQAGYAQFGMAFASDRAGATTETLFINGFDAVAKRDFGLASIDLTALTIASIGDFSGMLAHETAELTGNGEGKLFGFFTTAPNATFAEIDKKTGATSNERVLDGVSTGNAWAFSYWGGDFWFYTATEDQPVSTITRLAASGDNTLSAVKTNADVVAKTNASQTFHIVGAGVSTCAPLEPPK